MRCAVLHSLSVEELRRRSSSGVAALCPSRLSPPYYSGIDFTCNDEDFHVSFLRTTLLLVSEFIKLLKYIAGWFLPIWFR